LPVLTFLGPLLGVLSGLDLGAPWARALLRRSKDRLSSAFDKSRKAFAASSSVGAFVESRLLNMQHQFFHCHYDAAVLSLASHRAITEITVFRP
jgi:hypothetical protein